MRRLAERVLRLGLAISLVVASAGVGARGVLAADPGDIQLAQAGGGTRDSIDLTIPEGRTSAADLVFVRQTGSSEIQGVRLFIRLSGVTATVTPVDLSPDQPFDVPANGVVVPVRILVSDAERPGTFIGDLVALVSGKIKSIAKVTVTQQGRPDLRIVEAVGDVLTFSNAGSTFRRTITVVTSELAEQTMSFEVSPLRDETSAETTVDISKDGDPYADGSIVTVAQGTPAIFVLSATLNPGIYTGTVTIATPLEARIVTPLTITATASALTFALDEHDNQLAELPTPGDGLFIKVSGHETAGHALTLPLPTVSVARKESELTLDEPRARFVPTTGDVQVPPNGLATIEGRLTGLTEPGTYTVTAKFSTATGLSTATFDIFLRQSVLVAAASILAGIVAGWLLRKVLGQYLGALTARRRLQLLARRAHAIGARAEPSEKPVADGLEASFRQMSGIRTVLQRLPDDEALNGLERDVDVLERWTDVSKQARELGLESGHAAVLGEVGTYLAAPGRTPEDSLDKAQKLVQVERSLVAQRGLLARTAALRQIVAARRATATSKEADALAEIDSKLAEARAATVGNRVDEAGSALDAGSSAWLQLLLDGILDEFPESPPPVGVAPTSWRDLHRRLAADVEGARQETPDTGLARYDEIARSLVITLAQGLAAAAAERAAELGDERRAADVVGKLNEVAARCRDAVSSARSGATLDEARAAYEAAVDTYRQLPETAKATHRGVAATEAVRMAPATGGFELIAATASQAGQGLARTADQVGQRLAESPAVTEGAIVVIRSVGYATVVAIGVATGLFLLYANNLTWGGLSDQIAALLWGMGVHQIGGGTFGGVTEMAATLRSGGTLA